MLVFTIGLAAAGFAFLIIALTTGSIIWAWLCIAICMAGAVLLLVSALTSKRAVLPLDEETQLVAEPVQDAEVSDAERETNHAADSDGNSPDNSGGSAKENGEH